MPSTFAFWLCSVTIGCFGALPLPATASTFRVSIDATPLVGQSGFIAFDLVAGSSYLRNSAVVSSFDGVGSFGVPSSSGSVFGDLFTEVNLTSLSFFSEYMQSVVFAVGRMTFDLAISLNYEPNAIPDEFSIFLLKNDFAPYSTSDPTGANAIFVIDLLEPLVPSTFTSPSVEIFVVPAGVPEPGSLALIAVGLLLVYAFSPLPALGKYSIGKLLSEITFT